VTKGDQEKKKETKLVLRGKSPRTSEDPLSVRTGDTLWLLYHPLVYKKKP
jgi:hypothetical protein